MRLIINAWFIGLLCAEYNRPNATLRVPISSIYGLFQTMSDREFPLVAWDHLAQTVSGYIYYRSILDTRS